MSRRREINNNAQRRFRQRQRDRLQTLEEKLADATRRIEDMKLQQAHYETHLQRLGDTQVGAAGSAKVQMPQTGWWSLAACKHGSGRRCSCSWPLL